MWSEDIRIENCTFSFEPPPARFGWSGILMNREQMFWLGAIAGSMFMGFSAVAAKYFVFV